MAVSQKIVIYNDNIDIVTTVYDKDFSKNINRDGRKKHDFELISDKQFRKCLNEKIKRLKAHNKTLNYIRDNNSFNFYITIRGINALALKNFITRVRKADKELQYVSLASWSITSDLHYHILFNTNLSIEQLKSKSKKFDIDIKIITNQKELLSYFKKNLNYDTIHVLKHFDILDFRNKQIEILECSKILNYSHGIKHKPIIIKDPSQEQLQDIYNNTTYLETIEYNNLDSQIQIDKFESKNDTTIDTDIEF